MVDREPKVWRHFVRLKAVTMALLATGASALMFQSALAASINTEAASPQRTTPSRIQAPVTPPASVSSSRPAASPRPDGIPDQSWGGPIARPQPAPVAARQVRIPVLGREGLAAERLPTPTIAPTAPSPVSARPIAITASEPPLTSAVRPQDVASFQKIGAPYQVGGVWYVPAHEPNYDETGVASWYGTQFQGRPTANGEIFDMNVVSGAHPTLPIPSLVEVTNLSNGRSVVVRINDRGPFVGNRLIDLSARGAELLGFKDQGQANVRVRYVGPADAEPVVTAQNISTGRAAAAAKPIAPTGPAFVQLGAFSQLANAQRVAEQADGLGPVRVMEAATSEGNLVYRVVLGPVANREIAESKAQDMSMNGFLGARVLASLN